LVGKNNIGAQVLMILYVDPKGSSWWFPQMGHPPNGGFIMENPSKKMDDN